jgi:hypothetical protein
VKISRLIRSTVDRKPERRAPVELEPQPEPEPQPDPVPAPDPEPEPKPEPVPEPPQLGGRADATREWNIWDLERMAKGGEGVDTGRDEERSLLLVQLRQFAEPDGALPSSFDPLVRESFGELIAQSR